MSISIQIGPAKLIGREARDRGYYQEEEFYQVCEWKSKRIRSRVRNNSTDFIEATTGTALTSQSEQLRIEVLTLLRGVSWPMASVLLHFGHRDPYPILDYRALWSLGIDRPIRYSFALWNRYTKYCRGLSERNQLTMREVDRALWQYSKANQ